MSMMMSSSSSFYRSRVHGSELGLFAWKLKVMEDAVGLGASSRLSTRLGHTAGGKWDQATNDGIRRRELPR